MTFVRNTNLMRFTNGVYFYNLFWVQDNNGFPPGVGDRISYVLSVLKSHPLDMNHISDAVILLIVAETYRGLGFCDEQAVSSILNRDDFMQEANAKFDTQLQRDTTFTRCGFVRPDYGAPAHDDWEHSGCSVSIIKNGW